MASTINASSTGSGGLINTGDASGQLELQANGVTKMTVSSSGVSIPAFVGANVNLTTNVTGTLPIANGGTNSTATATAGGIGYGTGSAHAYTSAGTSGQPLVSGGAGAPAFRPYTLPAADGTNGQVLQTNGSGALSFATPAGGSWTYLSTVTASNSTTANLETTIDSTYDVYAVVGSQILFLTSGYYGAFRVKIAGSYETTGIYYGAGVGAASNGATPSGYGVGNGADRMYLTGDTNACDAAPENFSFVLYLFNPSSTSLNKTVLWSYARQQGATASYMYAGGSINSTSAMTGIQFFSMVGNITGTFRLYGIKNS